MSAFARKKSGAKAGVICLLLGIAFVIGAVQLNNSDSERRMKNARLVAESAFVQDIVKNLQIEPSGDAYVLRYEPRGDLRARKPYAVIGLAVDEETLAAHPVSMPVYSEGSSLTEAGLSACKSIVFALSDHWATAEYTSGNQKIVGTSERKRCYIYDVEEGVVFAEGELKARELPDRTPRNPHYYVSEQQLKAWVEAQISGRE